MSEQRPSKDQLYEVSLTPEQDARVQGLIAECHRKHIDADPYVLRIIVYLEGKVALLNCDVAEAETDTRAANARTDQMTTAWVELRKALRGIQSCSTCEACRGAATLALGGAATPPTDVLTKAAENLLDVLDAALVGAPDTGLGVRPENYLPVMAHIEALRSALTTEGGHTHTNQKCPRCGYVTANVFDCPTCKNPLAPFGTTEGGPIE